jgi:hypothetical protein
MEGAGFTKKGITGLTQKSKRILWISFPAIIVLSFSAARLVHKNWTVDLAAAAGTTAIAGFVLEKVLARTRYHYNRTTLPQAAEHQQKRVQGRHRQLGIRPVGWSD